MSTLLTVNSGSSSLKACLFHTDGTRRDWRYGHIGQVAQRQAVQVLDVKIKRPRSSKKKATKRGHKKGHSEDRASTVVSVIH